MSHKYTSFLFSLLLLISAPTLASGQESTQDASSESVVAVNDGSSETPLNSDTSSDTEIVATTDKSQLTESQKVEQLDFALAMATISLRKGDISSSKHYVTYGLSFKDDNAQLWYLDGLVKSAEQAWQEAIKSLEKAHQLDNKISVDYELASAYYNLKDFDQAAKYLGDCGSYRCEMLRGLMALSNEDFEQAVSHFDKSSALASQSDMGGTIPANFYSSALKLSMGQFQDAKNTLQQSYQLSKEANTPWPYIYANLMRTLHLVNFTGTLGLHFDSNIAQISDSVLAQLKANGSGDLSDLNLSINLAGNFRYFFTKNFRMNLGWAFDQQLYLFEGPSTAAYDMTSVNGNISLAYGWGKRPTLNYADLSYSISSAWVKGEKYKDSVGLDFYALVQQVGPSVNLSLGKHSINAGYRLLIDRFDDSAFIPTIADAHGRNTIGHRLHAVYTHHTLSSLSLGAAINGGFMNANADDYDRGFFGANFRLNWVPSYRGNFGMILGYSLFDYNHHVSDRFDNQLDVTVNLGSLLNTFMNLGIDVIYTHRWSNIDAYSFDRILVGLNLAFTL